MDSYHARFGALQRLFGGEGVRRLRASHVAVIGLGGVGSWAVESLARSGLGSLTLVDLDDICIGNVNRQLHALDGEFGKPKADVLAARVRAINPECTVHPLRLFFTNSTAEEILKPTFDFILDAIDSPSKKRLLLSRCRNKGLPVITVGASAGRCDPLAVRIADLAVTSHDRLLQEVRKKLRVRDGFPRNGPFNVPCVYSTEEPVYPSKDGGVCVRREPAQDARLDCETGFGTASFVTGAFGLAAASHIVRTIAQTQGETANIRPTLGLSR
jgi:tRNA threonylcarbamoyladenosine dehydratase